MPRVSSGPSTGPPWRTNRSLRCNIDVDPNWLDTPARRLQEDIHVVADIRVDVGSFAGGLAVVTPRCIRFGLVLARGDDGLNLLVGDVSALQPHVLFAPSVGTAHRHAISFSAPAWSGSPGCRSATTSQTPAETDVGLDEPVTTSTTGAGWPAPDGCPPHGPSA